MRVFFSKRAKRIASSTIDIRDHFGVPEADDAVARGLDEGGARGVAVSIVLAAVEFDRQPRLDAEEIDDVPTDGRLAAELGGLELTIAEARPEQAFDLGRVAAEACRMRAGLAEANNGGAMVESVLRAADAGLPVRLVHAAHGKAARAEPVAALYEAGRAFHLGAFSALEDEMAGLMLGGNYAGPGRSPDRADALVWAMTELMLGPRARRPGIREL